MAFERCMKNCAYGSRGLESQAVSTAPMPASDFNRVRSTGSELVPRAPDDGLLEDDIVRVSS